jgi:DNA-binding winged helix-turn-helix (wHTH) protein
MLSEVDLRFLVKDRQIFTLRTGIKGTVAYFTPSIFQIRLVNLEESSIHDIGFSGTRLLEKLLLNKGDALSREELTQYAWPDRVVGQGSLNQQIYTLRQLLNDDKDRSIIQTLPRRGYLLDASAILAINYLDISEPSNNTLNQNINPLPLHNAERISLDANFLNALNRKHAADSGKKSSFKESHADQVDDTNKLTDVNAISSHSANWIWIKFKHWLVGTFILIILFASYIAYFYSGKDTEFFFLNKISGQKNTDNILYAEQRVEPHIQKYLQDFINDNLIGMNKHQFNVSYRGGNIHITCLGSVQKNSLLIHPSQLTSLTAVDFHGCTK